MAEAPLVSVIMPAYNQARYIRQALDSALSRQNIDIEIIVVDDGSTDETPEILKGYDDRVRVIKKNNQGVALARNTGIDAASGRFVAFLDADDRWLPGHLEKSIEALEKSPDIGLAYSDARVIDQDGGYLKMRLSPAQADTASLVLGNFITTSSVVLKKTCLEECGVFDPAFRYASEDWDLWMRIASAYRLVHTGEALVEYRRHPESAIQKLGYEIRDNSLLAVANAFSRNPGLRQSLRQKAEALMYIESGVRCFAAIEPARARQELLSAIKRRAFIPRAWLLLMLSLLGKTGLSFVMNLLRRESPGSDKK